MQYTFTNNTQNNIMKQNIQNRTYVTIRIHKHNNITIEIHNLQN